MANSETHAKTPKMVTTGSGMKITQRQLYVIMGGVLLGMLLSSLDQTVVGPAMFRIVRDLQGLEHYAWVTTGYLLTSTITIPIAGKLGDIYGRKWFLIGGMLLFMVGSALSGLSSGTAPFSILGAAVPGLTTGMAQLIAFRALQGVGGGLLTSAAFTVIGDLIPPIERAKWQGTFAAVFGFSSIIGPTIGGFITDHIGWQWVFYVNIPVGIVAVLVLLIAFPHLRVSGAATHNVDWLGAFLLMAATTPVLLALSLGGTADFPWTSEKTIGMFVFSAVMLAAFIATEMRAKEPLLPLDLFKNRIFTLSVISVTVMGLGMFGAMINLPLFIQGVQGGSATLSGNSIVPMMLGMMVVSVGAGQIISRTGKYRILAVSGISVMAVGMFLLSTMNVHTPLWRTIAYMVVMGAGMGAVMPIFNIIVQSAFPLNRLGVVTSAVTFFRSIGGTVGVAVLGTVVNNRFSSDFTANLPEQLKANPQFGASLAKLTPQVLLSPQTIATLHAHLVALGLAPAQIAQTLSVIQAPIKPALGAATTEAFLIGAIVLVVAVVSTALIPEIPLRRRPDPKKHPAPAHAIEDNTLEPAMAYAAE